jgi:signal transduction histidine kinase
MALDIFRNKFTALNLAAFVAWSGIAYILFLEPAPAPLFFSGPAPLWLRIVLPVVFLALFLWPCSEQNTGLRKTFVLMQIGLVFFLCMVAKNYAIPILLIIAMAQAASVWSTRGLIVLFVLVNIGMYWVNASLWQMRDPLINTVLNSSFQGFAALTAWYAHSAEAARATLAQTNAELLATQSLLDARVRDSERLRIARELHDVAGHKLTALKIQLSALSREHKQSADHPSHLCAELSHELLQDIRNLVQQIRSEPGLKLADAIDKFSSSFAAPTLVHSIDEGIVDAPLSHSETILRAVQESLTNAAKHSGAASLWVVVQREAEHWRVHIRDDGRVPAQWHEGNGLRGMRERFEQLGGGLKLIANSHHSMQIEAWLPVHS